MTEAMHANKMKEEVSRKPSAKNERNDCEQTVNGTTNELQWKVELNICYIKINFFQIMVFCIWLGLQNTG